MEQQENQFIIGWSMIRNNVLIKKYFDENSLVRANLDSFNNFIEKRMQGIVKEVGEIIPTITPVEMEEFKIVLEKIEIEKPSVVEADGSKRDILPSETRLRKISYSAPVYLNVSVYIDGIQREQFRTEIGKLPVMLRSKYCHLYGLNREQTIEKGEDPEDLGGYFILNGNERVLITVEDLASNKMFFEKKKIGPSSFVANIFSERGSYRIPHKIEQMKDGIIYLSFTRFKRIPVVSLVKALGLTGDEDIMRLISSKEQYDDILINLYNSVELKKQNDALEFVAKKMGFTLVKEEMIQKATDNIDKYLLPHLGITEMDRTNKAYNLCKIVKRFLIISKKGINVDKDHYMNKRLKLSGDLLADLFRVNLMALINDLLYNFQRLVKRGKFTSVKIIIRDKLLTSRIKSSIATGTWVGGRKGISQNMDRTNFLAACSHLQRVVSLLSATQENFDARALHSTHFGRLCPIETPEGTSIGLRKNLAILCNVAQGEFNEEKLKKSLQSLGLNNV